jgi:polyvinyl alcohol dehydrogenase (cytochrome)
VTRLDKSLLFSRRAAFAAAGATALAPAIAVVQDAATPVASPVGEATPAATPVPPTGIARWPRYGRDLDGSRFNPQGVIASSNAPALTPIWSVDVGGPVSATPILAEGVGYVGSYDGNLYAIEIASGSVLWTYETGAAVPEPNLQIPLGITGSALFEDGVVYVGDAAANMHAIDAATGEAIWTTLVDDQDDASIWSSPIAFDGALYVGVASVAKQQGFRGSVVALDIGTGQQIWRTFMVPENEDGAGVFAVPAIDETRGTLYVGTQNAYTEGPDSSGNPISIVALDAATGDIAWAFNAALENDTDPTEVVGFSASPNLFTAIVDGADRDLVGNGQKSGVYWAHDRDTGEVVWSATVSPAGFLGGMEGTSAVANGVIAIAATDWPEFEGPASGMVTAVDAATGAELWSNPQDAPAASPATISTDVVLHAGMDGILHAYNLTDGEELLALDLGASVSGGIAVDAGIAILGTATPRFAEFVRPGSQIQAFAIQIEAATPAASPGAPVVPPASPDASPSPVA